MTLSFTPSEITVGRGRKSEPIPEHIVGAVKTSLETGKAVETEGPASEVHKAALQFRRYRKEHPEFKISISERETGKGSAFLWVKVTKAKAE